jgi:hypothetical protein
MKSVYIRKFALAMILSSVALGASATAVDFSFKYSGQPYGSGSFMGSDLNSDGRLTMNELTSFTSDLPGEGVYGLRAYSSRPIARQVITAHAK